MARVNLSPYVLGWSAGFQHWHGNGGRRCPFPNQHVHQFSIRHAWEEGWTAGHKAKGNHSLKQNQEDITLMLCNLDRVKFNMFCDWLSSQRKDIGPENWELRLLEFELGYRV